MTSWPVSWPHILTICLCYSPPLPPPPSSQWIQQPERIRDRRNILVDCSCFTLLTPLVCVSTWLCLNGAYHYLNFYEERGWEGVGLVTLASILIFIYLFWSLVRYSFVSWFWKKKYFSYVLFQLLLLLFLFFWYILGLIEQMLITLFSYYH